MKKTRIKKWNRIHSWLSSKIYWKIKKNHETTSFLCFHGNSFIIPLFSRLNHDSFSFFSFSFIYLSPVSFFLRIALLESSPHTLDRSPNKTINSFIILYFPTNSFFIHLFKSIWIQRCSNPKIYTFLQTFSKYSLLNFAF